MSILDLLTSNIDRHNANWMMAIDNNSEKIRIFPVDNTLGEIRIDEQSPKYYIESDDYAEVEAYATLMPKLIEKVGSDNIYKIYENEISRIVTNLNSPLYKPKGFEMDKIIEKWGTYDAFKDAVSARLKKLVTKDTEEYNALKSTLRLGYWN